MLWPAPGRLAPTQGGSVLGRFRALWRVAFDAGTGFNQEVVQRNGDDLRGDRLGLWTAGERSHREHDDTGNESCDERCSTKPAAAYCTTFVIRLHDTPVIVVTYVADVVSIARSVTRYQWASSGR